MILYLVTSPVAWVEIGVLKEAVGHWIAAVVRALASLPQAQLLAGQPARRDRNANSRDTLLDLPGDGKSRC
jgi:hypothetical protein